ncbi:PBP1A family penicillin-binding protein [Evansella sp. AB-P1]|uniref:transglycosylase domain-containing protein n=1 Tax=Evansella sp. AB-P1 TaxID=3037653 RepID=UPI00241CB8E8|nr:PBP1A family penicillin-binding protein [Evansella sp. AB-P1]MDG5787374.1 PBP1A family penicillin-binding protein [Evansella sp. AB-P1]
MEVLTRTQYRKKKRLWRRLFQYSILFIALGLGVAAAVVTYAYQMEAPTLSVPETTVIYSSNDDVIGEMHYGQNRHWIPLEHMGDAIIEATLAIEDRRFYDHYGFDFFRIGGAVVTNLRTSSMAQGASTITQQYARNLYLSHDKTWSRKWNEAFYALRLELHYPKNEILEGYLNTIYYGHGAYGIEAAANLYFQKNAEDLTIAEAALLAGIPKGPSIYSPFINEDRAKERQEIVLYSMAESGFISQSQMESLASEPLTFPTNDDIKAKKIAPYFQDEVMKWLTNDFSLDPALLESGGLEIHTTLDSDLQKMAEKWVSEKLGEEGELQTALVAQDPQNGKVRALIGGRDYEESEFNRATQAKRHPGSTFKPFLYYAALENGLRPNSMLKSEETIFLFDEGRGEYDPGNFNHRYADDYITMLHALAVSDNIFAVKTHFLLGFETLKHTAHRFGIESELELLPSLALGASDVGILEMTNSYNAFANGGYRVKPHFVEKVVDRDGNILYEAEPTQEKRFNPDLISVMNNMMQGMFEPEMSDPSYAYVTGDSISQYFDRPIAGKSGSNEKNSWMIGYTPQLITGVWVGYDRGKDLEPGDANHPKAIWARFMQEALQDEMKLPFEKTDNVVEIEINPITGLLATEDCPVSRPTYFYAGTEPTEYCTVHIEDDEKEEDRVFDKHQKKEEEKREKWLDRFLDWIN